MNQLDEGISLWFDEISAEFLDSLLKFAKESNEIEGICDKKSHKDACERLQVFMALDELTVQDVCDFNTVGELRTKKGMDVRIGNHVPPSGNMGIMYELESIIDHANKGKLPFFTHVDFETLHPFMDGNGRTGRAIWLWQMINNFEYNLSNGFLKQWYCQSLSVILRGDDEDNRN